MTRSAADPIPIDSVQVSVYDIPTDSPESDGTLSWDSTTFVLVTVGAGGRTGVGYTYAGPATATVVNSKLAGVLTGRDALLPAARWNEMQHAVRNLGAPGVVGCRRSTASHERATPSGSFIVRRELCVRFIGNRQDSVRQ
ncbi:hypothetical protein ACQP2U_07930 [Nocardia sp. CA-084685]|uniref:hypothetical protein n=1 Tax=Nocardia sp. CA-084685 TaxID=3239970 RepID=UPI003D984061